MNFGETTIPILHLHSLSEPHCVCMVALIEAFLPDSDTSLVIGDDYVRESKSSSFKFHENVVLDIDAHTVAELEAWNHSQ